jgi:PAS domain S-box-containing protein
MTECILAKFRLHRLTRLHTVLSNICEAIVRTRDLQELYDAVCRIVVEDGRLFMVCIAEVDAEAGLARPAASCGAGQEFLREPASVIPMDGPLSRGTVGTVLRTGLPDFCNDIARAARMKPWHKTALKNGLLADAAFPLKLNGATVAVLVLYAGETGYFQDDEIRLMASVAGHLSFALEALQTERHRQRAENALFLFRASIDQSYDSIEVLDAETRLYLDMNERCCASLGYSRQEMLTLSESDICPETEPALRVRIEQELESAGSSTFKTVRRRKNGTIFPVEVKLNRLHLDKRYVVAVVRDITERERTDARFRRLVDSNIQGVFFWNTNGWITASNEAFLAMVGHTRQDLEAGRLNWAAMTPPEYVENDRRALRETAATGFCKPYEKEYIRKDGSRVPILIGAAMFEDNPEEGVCFVLDLTERKRIQQQVIRAQRRESIGTLAGGIAHDLNNALSPILMGLGILDEQVKDAASRKCLAVMEASARHGAELVSQMLSFTRGVDGRRIPVNLVRVLREIQSLVRDTFPKNVRFEFNPSPSVWKVTGDHAQLHQVFTNLCMNARDAMPNGGLLKIGIENFVVDEVYAGMNPDSKPGLYIVVNLTDSGTGIPPAIRDRIFDPFFTTKEIGMGTGLGLSTTLAIVKSHGGFIHFDSEMGRGTTFKVYLPADTGSPQTENGITTKPELPRGSGQTILLVDDETAIRIVAQRTLERAGYRVLIASNGAEAVALYAQDRKLISIVLTDMAMPVMDGSSTIAALKTMNPKVKIIGSSGLSTRGNVASDAGSHIRHFLPKPYTTETLLKAVAAVLREPA